MPIRMRTDLERRSKLNRLHKFVFSFRVTDFVKRLIYKTLLQSLSLSCFVYSANNLIFIKINNN